MAVSTLCEISTKYICMLHIQKQLHIYLNAMTHQWLCSTLCEISTKYIFMLHIQKQIQMYLNAMFNFAQNVNKVHYVTYTKTNTNIPKYNDTSMAEFKLAELYCR